MKRICVFAGSNSGATARRGGSDSWAPLRTRPCRGSCGTPSLGRVDGGLSALVRPFHGRDLACRVVLEALLRDARTAAA